MQDHIFRDTVIEYYAKHGRYDLPWRDVSGNSADTGYRVLVSEMMLQQTQVSRVVPKFTDFVVKFPDIQSLASAQLADVLKAWSGLGYNRRAKFLHLSVQMLDKHYQGKIPVEIDALKQLPGIGPNTAAAILVYTYNQPLAFVETNIRTVYIHHYFADRSDVADSDLLPIIQRTQDPENPREWFWALMDYGTHLKQTVGNMSRYSATYAKQSKFAGSNRQIRGQVIRLLTTKSLSKQQLEREITDTRLDSVLQDLVEEGLVKKRQNTYHL